MIYFQQSAVVAKGLTSAEAEARERTDTLAGALDLAAAGDLWTQYRTSTVFSGGDLGRQKAAFDNTRIGPPEYLPLAARPRKRVYVVSEGLRQAPERYCRWLVPFGRGYLAALV